MTKKWLREKEIPYDKLILTKYKKEKAEKCIENGIDVMIDDSNSICRECYKKNITTLIMDKPCNREEKEITRVYNWKDIYEFITNYKKEKVEYPCKEFWEIASEYKKLKVLYGIDAHWREQIELYEKAVELANEIIGKDIISKLHFCDENLEI